MEEKFNQAGFFEEQHYFFVFSDFNVSLIYLEEFYHRWYLHSFFQALNAFRNCSFLDLCFEKALGCKIYVSCNFALEAREMQMQLYVVW